MAAAPRQSQRHVVAEVAAASGYDHGAAGGGGGGDGRRLIEACAKKLVSRKNLH